MLALSNEGEKTRLLESLQKGNRQAVTFQREGQEQRMYVEASPKFKSVNVYDGNLQRVHSQTQKEKNIDQSVKQESKKEGRKQASDDTGDFAEPKQKRSRRKGQSIN